MRLAWRSTPHLLLGGTLALAPALAASQSPAPPPPAERDRATQVRPGSGPTDQDRVAREKAEQIGTNHPKAAIPDAGSRGSTPRPIVNEGETEEQVLSLVRDHLPQLAEVLGPLKTTHPAEYRKAIAELAHDARSLAEMKGKNPARYPFALDAWKARTRVELLAAQLTRTPSVERENQLRAAIRERVEADIRRNRFEVDQAEATVTRNREILKKAEASRDRARAALTRAEEGRDGRIEARFQALFPQVKKSTSPPQTASGPMGHPTTPVPHD